MQTMNIASNCMQGCRKALRSGSGSKGLMGYVPPCTMVEISAKIWGGEGVQPPSPRIRHFYHLVGQKKKTFIHPTWFQYLFWFLKSWGIIAYDNLINFQLFKYLVTIYIYYLTLNNLSDALQVKNYIKERKEKSKLPAL